MYLYKKLNKKNCINSQKLILKSVAVIRKIALLHSENKTVSKDRSCVS